MAVSTYLSIITSNVNGLNAAIKKHRMADWIKNHNHLCAAYEKFTSGLMTHTD